MIVLLAILLWWAVGVAGFVFWWTNEHDLEIGDLTLGVIAGVMGPLTWPIGWCIHGDHSASSRPIMRRRGRR
jgi:hypothetical protein